MTTVGILGGGQLARMMAVAALQLGQRVRVYDPARNPPAGAVAEHIAGEWHDADALARFCAGLSVATVDMESVPATVLRQVANRVRLRPSLLALETAQDRLAEKELARTLGIATPRFARVAAVEQLDAALRYVAVPAILKRRRGGYDGRGQASVSSHQEAAAALTAWHEPTCLLEQRLSFEREVSQVAVRAASGQIGFYPLVENTHIDGILWQTIAPAPDRSPQLAARAREVTRALLESLDYVGVLTVEFFVCDGALVFNEIAPRVHNSGHWTIEGATTSQFENHLRAILDLPLGSTSVQGYSLLRNILSTIPDSTEVLRVPGTSLHLYGKEPAPQRKLGHITVRARSRQQLARRESMLPPPSPSKNPADCRSAPS